MKVELLLYSIVITSDVSGIGHNTTITTWAITTVTWWPIIGWVSSRKAPAEDFDTWCRLHRPQKSNITIHNNLLYIIVLELLDGVNRFRNEVSNSSELFFAVAFCSLNLLHLDEKSKVAEKINEIIAVQEKEDKATYAGFNVFDLTSIRDD